MNIITIQCVISGGNSEEIIKLWVYEIFEFVCHIVVRSLVKSQPPLINKIMAYRGRIIVCYWV